MVVRVATVAFEGIEARPVDVQVQVTPGNVVFNVVGLGDKAVTESRERLRAALIASGLAMPAKRITVNLAPADLPKEGSHYDLPIALGIMAAIGAMPSDMLSSYLVLGELALDGTITAVAGVLPAAIAANGQGLGLICPRDCGSEAAWASTDLDVLAPVSLIQLANHFKGTQVLARPRPAIRPAVGRLPDLRDIKGQEGAKRALEIAAAGGHNLLKSCLQNSLVSSSRSPVETIGRHSTGSVHADRIASPHSRLEIHRGHEFHRDRQMQSVDPRDYDIEALVRDIWGPKACVGEAPTSNEVFQVDRSAREKQNRDLAAALILYLERCQSRNGFE